MVVFGRFPRLKKCQSKKKTTLLNDIEEEIIKLKKKFFIRNLNSSDSSDFPLVELLCRAKNKNEAANNYGFTLVYFISKCLK